MSVHSTNGQQRSSVSVGTPPDAATDPVVTFDNGDASPPTAHIVTPRTRRRVDYRLRGLDLGAQKRSDAPVLPVRTDPPNRRHRRRVAMGWAVVVILATVIALVLRLNVVEPFAVPSAAMAPTIQAGDRIVVVKSRWLAGPIERGSIIVFHRPQPYSCRAGASGEQDLVQRVIGMPGQSIWSVRDTVYVDGHAVHNLHLPGSGPGTARPKPIPLTTVPAGEYFVMGDNPSQSCDSRSFGAVPASSVVGRVVSIFLRGGHPYVHVF